MRQAERAENYQLLTRQLDSLLQTWHGFHWSQGLLDLRRAKDALERRQGAVGRWRTRAEEQDARAGSLRRRQAQLRESISAFKKYLSDLPVSGLLANCCAPESITSGLPQLIDTGVPHTGGYANSFLPIPEDWTLDGDMETDGFLDLRTDLDPENYAEHVGRWLKAGANVVGGCCGTGPYHIAKIYELFFQ